MQFDNNQKLILISDTNTNNTNEDWFIDCYWFLLTDFTWSNIHMNIQLNEDNWHCSPPPHPKIPGLNY